MPSIKEKKTVGLEKYYFPEYRIAIEAVSQEEALALLRSSPVYALTRQNNQ